jgi:large subunit ribosomal protein L31e
MPKFSTKQREPAKIATTIHIQKLVHNSVRKRKAQRAIKEIVKAGQTIMGTQTVKIDQELNSRIWQRSQANPPVRVRVIFERKADDKGTLYTVASLQDVASFAGLKTEKVVE